MVHSTLDILVIYIEYQPWYDGAFNTGYTYDIHWVYLLYTLYILMIHTGTLIIYTGYTYDIHWIYL